MLVHDLPKDESTESLAALDDSTTEVVEADRKLTEVGSGLAEAEKAFEEFLAAAQKLVGVSGA